MFHGHFFLKTIIYIFITRGKSSIVLLLLYTLLYTLPTFSVQAQEALQGFIDINKGLCTPTGSGDLVVRVTGGKQPYSVVWSNGETSPILKGVSVGSYSATVTDNLGTSIVLGPYEFTPPASSLNLVRNAIEIPSCNGGDDGLITVSATGGGGGPYTYQWSYPNTNNRANNLKAGTYSVTVSDIWGCTTSQTYTLTEPRPLAVDYTQRSPSCPTCSDGALFISPVGGTFPYLISVDNGQTFSIEFNYENLPVGTYPVIIRDNKNCRTTRNINLIYEPPPCTAPDIIHVFTAPTYATVLWEGPQQPAKYYLGWRPKGTNDVFKVIGLPDPNIKSFTIAGLNPNTEYEVRVRARCDVRLSPWSILKTFKTEQGQAIECNPPANIIVTPQKGSLLFEWDRVDIATRYYLSWRRKSPFPNHWKTIALPPSLNPKFELMGLEHDADYEYRLQIRCSEILSNHTNIQISRTLGFRSENGLTTQTPEFTIYPNPSTDYIYIRSNTSTESSKLSVYDLTGKKIDEHIIHFQSYNNVPSPETMLNLSHLNNGVYILQIEPPKHTDQKHTERLQLIISR